MLALNACICPSISSAVTALVVNSLIVTTMLDNNIIMEFVLCTKYTAISPLKLHLYLCYQEHSDTVFYSS